MTINAKVAGCALLLALLPSCTANDIGMGNAVRSNYAAQIVEPDPQYTAPVTANGDQTAAAQDRYRRGAVKRPRSIRTTSGSGGGA